MCPGKIGVKSISLYHISASLGLAKTRRISTFLVFDTTKLSIDAVCTVFNAAMNSAGDGVLEMLLDENVAGLMQYVDALQKAGY